MKKLGLLRHRAERICVRGVLWSVGLGLGALVAILISLILRSAFAGLAGACFRFETWAWRAVWIGAGGAILLLLLNELLIHGTPRWLRRCWKFCREQFLVHRPGVKRIVGRCAWVALAVTSLGIPATVYLEMQNAFQVSLGPHAWIELWIYRVRMIAIWGCIPTGILMCVLLAMSWDDDRASTAQGEAS